MMKEKEKFEDEFVRLNCEIQQVRSDNEGLLDEIRLRQTELDGLDAKIREKASLIQIIEQRIHEMNEKHPK